MLRFETIETQPNPEASIIFLHGLGANGFDLMNIVPSLAVPSSLSIRFIFPHAPMRPITLNNGMKMPGWFDITGLTLNSRQDLAGLEQARYQIDQLIEAEIKKGIKPEKIMLGGFSQGGALSLFTGLQSVYPLAGLIVLSSYFPCVAKVEKNMSPLNKSIPIFIAHGTLDDVVRYEWGELAKKELARLGCGSIEWHEYPIAHEICLPELRDLSKFIIEKIS